MVLDRITASASQAGPPPVIRIGPLRVPRRTVPHRRRSPSPSWASSAGILLHVGIRFPAAVARLDLAAARRRRPLGRDQPRLVTDAVKNFVSEFLFDPIQTVLTTVAVVADDRGDRRHRGDRELGPRGDRRRGRAGPDRRAPGLGARDADPDDGHRVGDHHDDHRHRDGRLGRPQSRRVGDPAPDQRRRADAALVRLPAAGPGPLRGQPVHGDPRRDHLLGAGRDPAGRGRRPQRARLGRGGGDREPARAGSS